MKVNDNFLKHGRKGGLHTNESGVVNTVYKNALIVSAALPYH